MLEQVTTRELEALARFAVTMIVKDQTAADLAEVAAIKMAGGFLAMNSAPPMPRPKYREVYILTEPPQPPEKPPVIKLHRELHWIHRPVESTAAWYALAPGLIIWVREGSVSSPWKSIPGNLTHVGNPPPTWGPILGVPKGRRYVSVTARHIYAPVMRWVSETTGETWAEEPAVPDPIVTGKTRPAGLSDVIPYSQEYVTAKIMLASGLVSDDDKITPGDPDSVMTSRSITGYTLPLLEEAIELFELPGLWSDPRVPTYQEARGGGVMLQSDGQPLRNSSKETMVPFQGELNTYYRGLAKDYGISPFASRTAGNLELLAPGDTTGLTEAEIRAFAAAYSQSVHLFKRVFHDGAFAADPMYPAYCRMFVAWMAISKTMDDRIGASGDVDRMNQYGLTNLLYSHGIYEFDDFPIVYKRRLAKSINGLLANKGSFEVFRKILEIFHLADQAKIETYYMVKRFANKRVTARFPRFARANEGYRVTDKSLRSYDGDTLQALADKITSYGEFVGTVLDSDDAEVSITTAAGEARPNISKCHLVLEGGATVGGIILQEEVNYEAPDVEFIAVDSGAGNNVERTMAMAQPDDFESYDVVTDGDPLWEMSREQAVEMDFSVLQTKYFSVSSSFDVLGAGMTVAMFYSVLSDIAVIRPEEDPKAFGALVLDGVTSATMLELMVTAIILLLWKTGADDVIPHGEAGVSMMLAARTDGRAFPGEGDLLPYSVELSRAADLGVPITGETAAGVVVDNMAVSKWIKGSIAQLGRAQPAGWQGASTWRQMTALRRMWDHKFISAFQTLAFAGYSSYSAWLRSTNENLYDWAVGKDATKNSIEAIAEIVGILDAAVGRRDFVVRSALGSLSVLLQYVHRMIDFFRAYTTDLRSLALRLVIDDPAFECARAMGILQVTGARHLRASGIPSGDSLAGDAGRVRRDHSATMVRDPVGTQGGHGVLGSAEVIEGFRYGDLELLFGDGVKTSSRLGPFGAARPRADWLQAKDAFTIRELWEEVGIVEVRVVEGFAMTPVEGATVTWQGDSVAPGGGVGSMTTAGDGVFINETFRAGSAVAIAVEAPLRRRQERAIVAPLAGGMSVTTVWMSWGLVRFEILDPDGYPASGVNVHVVRRGDGVSLTTLTDPEGVAEFPLEAGVYDSIVHRDDLVPATQVIEVDPSDASERMDGVQGVQLFRGGAPLAGVRVRSDPAEDGEPEANAVTDASGSAALSTFQEASVVLEEYDEATGAPLEVGIISPLRTWREDSGGAPLLWSAGAASATPVAFAVDVRGMSVTANSAALEIELTDAFMSGDEVIAVGGEVSSVSILTGALIEYLGGVTVTAALGPATRTCVTNAAGQFSFWLEPGSWVFSASPAGHAVTTAAATVTATEEMREVSIRCEKDGTGAVVPPACFGDWRPEDYGQQYAGRMLESVGPGAWRYSGDYSGCDGCASYLQAGPDAFFPEGPWVISFSITVFGASDGHQWSSRQTVTVALSDEVGEYIGTLNYYWDGAKFVQYFPSGGWVPLPEGPVTFSFAIPIPANTRIMAIGAWMDQCDSEECEYSDRPWEIHDLSCREIDCEGDETVVWAAGSLFELTSGWRGPMLEGGARRAISDTRADASRTIEFTAVVRRVATWNELDGEPEHWQPCGLRIGGSSLDSLKYYGGMIEVEAVEQPHLDMAGQNPAVVGYLSTTNRDGPYDIPLLFTSPEQRLSRVRIVPDYVATAPQIGPLTFRGSYPPSTPDRTVDAFYSNAFARNGDGWVSDLSYAPPSGAYVAVLSATGLQSDLEWHIGFNLMLHRNSSTAQLHFRVVSVPTGGTRYYKWDSVARNFAAGTPPTQAATPAPNDEELSVWFAVPAGDVLLHISACWLDVAPVRTEERDEIVQIYNMLHEDVG